MKLFNHVKGAWTVEPAYSASEASNLAVGSSLTGTELMYSFKVCWGSWCKHNFVSNKTYSPRIKGLLCVLIFFFFESCPLRSWTRFYFCADFFLPSSQCSTHSPSYNINLNTAVQFINILSSNPEMPVTIHRYKKRAISSTARIYVSAMLLALLWAFDRGDLWQAKELLSLAGVC